MRNIVQHSIYILLIVLFAGCALAATPLPLGVQYSQIKDTIYANESAYYQVNITNFNDFADRVQMYTINPYWDIFPTIINVGAQDTSIISLEITPLANPIYGPQFVPITIKSLTDQNPMVQNFYIYLKPSNETVKKYVTNVVMEVHMPSEVDPRESLSLEVYMRNRNPLDIQELKILVTSALFTKEYKTNLGPLEEKTNQILFADLDKYQAPGVYPITIQLIVDNKTVADSQREILVKSYADVTREDTRTKSLFSTTDKITLKNDGNYEATKSITLEKNFFERIFTTTSLAYTVGNDNGKSIITWDVPLKSRETYTITVTTNYIVLVIIVILIVLGTISYFVFRSPVLLFKRAKIVSSTEDGVSEIKVKLHIKNRSGKTIRNIKIIDKYPKIVQMEEDSSLGTMKPTKMLSSDKTHSLLTWGLDVLDPYEERLLVYKLKSRLNIVGNVSLPSAKIKFNSGAGERTYNSNEVTMHHQSHHHMSEKKQH
jgi:hypothetical protein